MVGKVDHIPVVADNDFVVKPNDSRQTSPQYIRCHSTNIAMIAPSCNRLSFNSSDGGIGRAST